MSRHNNKNMQAQKMAKGEMAKSLKAIGASLKKFYPVLIFAVILALVSTVLSVISPNILSDLTNTITAGNSSSSIDLDKVGHYALILLIIYLVSFVTNFLSNFLMSDVAQRYTKEMRKQISEKINRVPLHYFDTNSIGDILSILTNDVDQISQSFQQSLAMMISALFLLGGSIIAMFITSWQLALVAIFTLPIMVILLMIVLKLASPQFVKRQMLVGQVNGIVEENYNGQNVIKVFNAEDKMTSNFDKMNDTLKNTMFKAEFFGGLLMPVMNFMSYTAYAAVCVTGGLLLSNNTPGMTMGTITAFLIYVNLFQSPLSQIGQAMNSLQNAAASGSRVFNFLGVKELSDESDKVSHFDKEHPVKGEVTFEHVHFSYDESREIIHDFSAVVKPGMKVAIVGPTGAGKTTMVNLLMRFYEINQGNIKIDGIPISEMTRNELHSLFGMVLQDTWVFDGTLRENLSYNTANLTDEDYKQVIHDAHLTHFVRGLPGGLDYEIKDGGSISGGQKQLITIARAMLKKAPMLILDEATSNVDTRTEEKIQESMDRLTKGKTSFVIAHRLSTIRNADLILVMKDGNIIEQGNHDELLAQNGFYASLYNSQFALDGDNVID